MNKKPFIFVQNTETDNVTIHELPEKFDGNLGNYLVGLANEFGYGTECKFYIGNLA